MTHKVLLTTLSILFVLWSVGCQEDEEKFNSVDIDDDYSDAIEDISKLQRQLFGANTSVQLGPGFLLAIGGAALLLFLLSAAFAGNDKANYGQSSYTTYDRLYDNAAVIRSGISSAARRYMCDYGDASSSSYSTGGDDLSSDSYYSYADPYYWNSEAANRIARSIKDAAIKYL